MRPVRLIVLAKHPVYYTVPIFRALARDPRFDLEVLYWSDLSLRPVYFEEISTVFQPRIDLLSGYPHGFLDNWGRAESGDRFFSHLNPGLVAALARRRPDAVLVHGWDKASCWLALATARLLGQKVVLRGEATGRPAAARNGETRPGLPSRPVARLRPRLRDRLVRTFLRGADVVLYSCSGNRDFLEAHVDRPDKLRPFPCAVDNAFHRAEHARLLPRRAELRSELGISPEHVVLLFPARLTARKRPLDLARALARLGREGATAPFFALVVGDGPERGALGRALAEAGVPHALPGMADPSEMPRYFIAADAFVLLSDYDPSPKSLNEALNYGLPVLVSTAAGTAPDLVREGENGFLVPPGDIEAIAGALRRLAASDREALGARSLEIVADWSVEADVEALWEALREAPAGSAPEGAHGDPLEGAAGARLR